jgi:hypothetical protein
MLLYIHRSIKIFHILTSLQPTVEEEDEDNMEEIDLDNIVDSRTRGKQIDYAKAAEKAKEDGEELDDDDEEDDEDFDGGDDDVMQEWASLCDAGLGLSLRLDGGGILVEQLSWRHGD